MRCRSPPAALRSQPRAPECSTCAQASVAKQPSPPNILIFGPVGTGKSSFIRSLMQVVEDDVDVVFEVMSSVDRKQVHDVAAELDGVVSASEGEDPRRRVVLRKG